MNDIHLEKRGIPGTTVIESSTKSWLTVLVYVALTLFLARVAWRQVSAIISRADDLSLRSSDLVTLLVVALCGFLVFRIFQSLRNFYDSLRLDRSGEVGAAVVVDKWRRKSDEDEDYWIVIEYGNGISAKARVNYRNYQSVNIGEDLLIEYLPEQPEVVRIKPD